MIQEASNSYSTGTNVRFGAKDIPGVWWNVNALEMPTISMDVPKFNTRAGAAAGIAPDTATYSDFSVEIILDKKWKVYNEVYEYFLEGLNVENAKFSHFKKFELWVEFVDGQGRVHKKFWLHSARLLDFGGLQVVPNDPDDTLQTLTLSFSILYFSHPPINPFIESL